MADSSIERSKGRAMSEEDSDMFSFRTSTISNPNYQAEVEIGEPGAVQTEDPTASDGTLYPDLPGENVPVGEAIEAELDPLDEMKTELRKTEEEIDTLRQVLHAKENYASELRKKLGMTPLGQISSTFKQELNRVQSSNAYQATTNKVNQINEQIAQSEYYKKTSETLKSAGQSTASAFSTFGSTMSQKLNEMKNSQAFKSMEEKVEGVSTAIMAKVSGTGVEKQPEEGEEATESTPVTTQPQQAPEKASE